LIDIAVYAIKNLFFIDFMWFWLSIFVQVDKVEKACFPHGFSTGVEKCGQVRPFSTKMYKY